MNLQQIPDEELRRLLEENNLRKQERASGLSPYPSFNGPPVDRGERFTAEAPTVAPQPMDIPQQEMVAPQMVAPQMVAPQMVAPQMVAPQMVAPQMVAPEPQVSVPTSNKLEEMPTDYLVQLLQQKAEGRSDTSLGSTSGSNVQQIMHPDIPILDRLGIKNFGGDPRQMVEVLREKVPNLEFEVIGGRVAAKRPDEQIYKVLDPQYFGSGNLLEKGKEFLLDLGDIAYDIGSSVLETAATVKGAVLGGPAGMVGASAASSAGMETLRQKIGQATGYKNEFDKGNVVIAGALGAIVPAITGVGASKEATKRIYDLVNKDKVFIKGIAEVKKEGLSEASEHILNKVIGRSVTLGETLPTAYKKVLRGYTEKTPPHIISQITQQLDNHVPKLAPMVGKYAKVNKQINKGFFRAALEGAEKTATPKGKTMINSVRTVLTGVDDEYFDYIMKHLPRLKKTTLEQTRKGIREQSEIAVKKLEQGIDYFARQQKEQINGVGSLYINPAIESIKNKYINSIKDPSKTVKAVRDTAKIADDFLKSIFSVQKKGKGGIVYTATPNTMNPNQLQTVLDQLNTYIRYTSDNFTPEQQLQSILAKEVKDNLLNQVERQLFSKGGKAGSVFRNQRKKMNQLYTDVATLEKYFSEGKGSSRTFTKVEVADKFLDKSSTGSKGDADIIKELVAKYGGELDPLVDAISDHNALSIVNVNAPTREIVEQAVSLRASILGVSGLTLGYYLTGSPIGELLGFVGSGAASHPAIWGKYIDPAIEKVTRGEFRNRLKRANNPILEKGKSAYNKVDTLYKNTAKKISGDRIGEGKGLKTRLLKNLYNSDSE